jgi:hypothetical protein
MPLMPLIAAGVMTGGAAAGIAIGIVWDWRIVTIQAAAVASATTISSATSPRVSGPSRSVPPEPELAGAAISNQPFDQEIAA